jgi:hypothetical protein
MYPDDAAPPLSGDSRGGVAVPPVRCALAVVAVAAVLTACTSAPDTTNPASPTPVPTGAFGTVVGSAPVDTGSTESDIIAVAVNADGAPIVLAVRDPQLDEPLLLVRPESDDTVELLGQNTVWSSATLHLADDGTVVVTGYSDRRYAITRVAPDGVQTTVPVAVDLPPDGVGTTTTALSPDGGTLYLGYIDLRLRTTHLVALDTTTGAVTAEHTFAGDQPGLTAVTALAVAGDQLLATVDRGLDESNDAETAFLARFALPDLRAVGEVQLVDGLASSSHLVMHDGTAHLTLTTGDFHTDDGDLRLLSVAPDGRITEVAVFEGEKFVDALAVDPAGEWAYLGGLDNGDDESELTVTPVDLHGEIDADPVTVCEGFQVEGLAIDPAGERLVVGTDCREGADRYPELVFLRE